MNINTLEGFEKRAELRLFDAKWRLNHELGQVDVPAMLTEYEAMETRYKNL